MCGVGPLAASQSGSAIALDWQSFGEPMGEKEPKSLEFTFSGLLTVSFQRSRAFSEVSVNLVHELDERLGLETIIAAHLRDSRCRRNELFRLPDLLRQSIYSRLPGHEALKDTLCLAAAPALRLTRSLTRSNWSTALTSPLFRNRSANRIPTDTAS